MKVGCHVSIAGGIWNAPKNAADLGCEVFQIFSRSPRGGPAPKIDKETVGRFRDEMKKWNQKNFYIHAPYYINFASIDSKIRSSSIKVIREELERGSLLGAKYLMTHLGSSRNIDRKEALSLVKDAITEVMRGYRGKTKFLLEISAGAGEVIGDTFEELGYLAGKSSKIGICLDSAHMFASGYELRTKSGILNTIEAIKVGIGMENVCLIHANDSKVGLGERKDRHDHVGDGKIGIVGFKNLFNAFSDVDFILETKPDGVARDIKKIKRIRDNS